MKRSVDDRLAEALRRWRHGSMRPLWQDLPEEQKQWRRDEARTLLPILDTLGLEVRDKPNRDHDEPPTGAWGDLQAYGKKGESDD